jgi:hypothetical protein
MIENRFKKSLNCGVYFTYGHMPVIGEPVGLQQKIYGWSEWNIEFRMY